MTYVSLCLRKPSSQDQLACRRENDVPPELGAQISPNALAAGNGLLPTEIVWITVFVAGSILETVSSKTVGTKTVPSGATAAFSGPWPTWIVATTFRVFGSIRETVFERAF